MMKNMEVKCLKKVKMIIATKDMKQNLNVSNIITLCAILFLFTSCNIYKSKIILVNYNCGGRKAYKNNPIASFKLVNGKRMIFDTLLSCDKFSYEFYSFYFKEHRLNYSDSFCMYYKKNGRDLKKCIKLKKGKYLYIEIKPLKINLRSQEKADMLI
jgi:hypothetical protein